MAERHENVKDVVEQAKAAADKAKEPAQDVLGQGREKVPGGMQEGDQDPEQFEGMGMG
jgi:hypothetical protein